MNEIAIIEMPMGTCHKYEVDKSDGKLFLDRIIKKSIPYNYGYIPNTLSEDGDPIDVFVVSKEPIPPLTKVKINIIGIIRCNDSGENDDKLIAVIEGDETLYKHSEILEEIIDFLTNYKTGIDIHFSKSTGASLGRRVLKEAKKWYDANRTL